MSNYDDYDFVDYSHEELANIDVLTAAHFDPTLLQGCPEVRVELEGLVQIHEFTPSTLAQNHDNAEVPPIQIYRQNRVLSVTDLVSPMWCEVQFDYGLRQKRSRPLEMRPDSFVSASGKEISVEKTVAANNDAITKKGKAVHKELELELGLKQVQVQTTTQEERWALRIINFITGIEGILDTGYTRELPVFGIVHDEVIVGIIDEVKCLLYSNGKPDLAGFSSNNTSQMHISDYFISENTTKTKPNKRFTYVLQLIDTKTRWTNSLPSPEDTLPSRLQLMLYYRMLSDLVSECSPFNYSLLWDKLRLDSGRLFTLQFLVDAGLLQQGTTCLDDLVPLLHRAVEKLDLVGVNQELQLVYRSQPSREKRRRKENGHTIAIPAGISQEEHELSLAIEASLKDLEVQQNTLCQNNAPEDVAQSTVNVDSASSDVDAPPDQDISNHRVNGSDNDAEDSKIIGTREFYYDENFLNTQVSDILQWWYGKRKPNGVPIHLSRRCFSCEYKSDCEWREEKAIEYTRSMVQRKSTPTDYS